MKKFFNNLLIILLATILLTGCESLFEEETEYDYLTVEANTPSEDTEYDYPTVEPNISTEETTYNGKPSDYQLYTSYSYSESLFESSLMKGGFPIGVFVNNTDIGLRTVLEDFICKKLEAIGFEAFPVHHKYYLFAHSKDFDVELLLNEMRLADDRNFLEISVTDVSTYNYGGGIANFELYSNLFTLLNYEGEELVIPITNIITYTECESNEMLKERISLNMALDSASSSIVSEIDKISVTYEQAIENLEKLSNQ